MHKHPEASGPGKASFLPPSGEGPLPPLPPPPIHTPKSGNKIWIPIEMEKARGSLSVLLLRLLGKGLEVWWQLREEASCVLRALSSAAWGQQREGPAHVGISKG